MPIDDAEWREGRTDRTLEAQILLFLEEAFPAAFTEPELRRHVLAGEDIDEPILAGSRVAAGVMATRLGRALDTLVDEETVERKQIDEGSLSRPYYRAVEG